MPDGDLVAVPPATELDRVGPVEIVVGIPTLNSARTVGHVVQAVVDGLAAHYPGRACALVNADGGSSDGSPDLVRRGAGGRYPVVVVRHGPRALHRLAAGYPGFPGQGAALRGILEAAERLEARACALVDGDARGIAPRWIEALLEPMLRESMDFAAPVYAGHKYDKMLTTSLIAPLTRALYGRQVRQPVGGHFGLSGALARRFLRSGVWDRGAPQAVDIWMTTTALADGLRVCQVHLGAGQRAPRRAPDGLGQTFAQAIGEVFALMEEYRQAWWSVVATSPVPTFGPAAEVGVEPVSVNVDRMISTFRQGVAELTDVWRHALAPDTFAALAALQAEGATEFTFPAALWARAAYDCAVAYHQRLLPRRHLLRAMIPLYLGRAAAFVLGTASAGAAEVEAEIESLGRAFESLKPHLLDRWDARRP